MSGPDPRGQLEHMTAAEVGLGEPTDQPVDGSGRGRLLLNAYGRRCYDAGRASVQGVESRPVTDAERKAWKLVESLAEDCEYLPDGDHEWQKCRRCLAVAELSAPETRLLMRELLALRRPVQ
jgi:hypothetical protein